MELLYLYNKYIIVIGEEKAKTSLTRESASIILIFSMCLNDKTMVYSSITRLLAKKKHWNFSFPFYELILFNLWF